MKWIRNIFAASAVAIAAVACTIESEDTFSTSPVAPVMDAHSDILITNGTKAESVTFTWTAARFIDAESYPYLYNLNVKSGEKEVALKQGIKDAFCTISKEELRTFLKTNFELEKNATHSLSFSVSVADNAGKVYSSPTLAVKVYFYDDVVAPVLSAPESAIVLDKEKAADEIEVLGWAAARLEYGEDVTYKVTMTCGDGKETELAKDLDGTSFRTTVDGLNEAVIAAGATEGKEAELTFKVYAYCTSLPDGVVSNAVKVKITTYILSFPEKMWLPGSYQKWDIANAPALSLSTKQKGVYQGFVDLSTADGSDAEFKFSATPSWSKTDFGFEDVTVETKGSESLPFAYAESKTLGGSNIKVPSGLYYIKLDKKNGTLVMIQVKNLEIVGSFAASGWGTFFPMTKNGSRWTAAEDFEMKPDDEIKIRFNSDWKYSFGGELDNVVFGGDNIKFTAPAGKYEFVFDTETSDFRLDLLS